MMRKAVWGSVAVLTLWMAVTTGSALAALIHSAVTVYALGRLVRPV